MDFLWCCKYSNHSISLPVLEHFCVSWFRDDHIKFPMDNKGGLLGSNKAAGSVMCDVLQLYHILSEGFEFAVQCV